MKELGRMEPDSQAKDNIAEAICGLVSFVLAMCGVVIAMAILIS